MTDSTRTQSPRPRSRAGKLDQARDAASEAFDATKKSARRAAARASDEVEDYPVAMLAGGVAVGAILGAVIPASMRERELLGGAGKRLNSAAVAAAKAARDAGKDELDSLGLSKDAAGREANRLLDGVVKAAGTAGSAAAKAAKNKVSAG
jgi:ElaB/YqjD/DUF883 family membrane-anchored ribosome-binding protein